MNRRGFLTGLIAAPAIVAASNIMPVRAIERFADGHAAWSSFGNVWKVGDVIEYAGKLYEVHAVGTADTYSHFALPADNSDFLIGVKSGAWLTSSLSNLARFS